MHYSCNFVCCACAKVKQIGEDRYCMSIRSGEAPLIVDHDKRELNCAAYEPIQTTFFE